MRIQAITGILAITTTKDSTKRQAEHPLNDNHDESAS